VSVSWKRAAFTLLVCLGAVACGQGQEPIANLGDPSQSLGPGLALPMSVTGLTFNTFVPFSSAKPSWGLTGAYTGLVTPIVAPGTGFVMTADSASQTVSILHNSHIYTKVVGVIPAGVTVGSYVAGGSQIGTVANGFNTITFSVYADGVAVCPLSYLTSTARGQLLTSFYNASVFNSNPCQQ